MGMSICLGHGGYCTPQAHSAQHIVTVIFYRGASSALMVRGGCPAHTPRLSTPCWKAMAVGFRGWEPQQHRGPAIRIFTGAAVSLQGEKETVQVCV